MPEAFFMVFLLDSKGVKGVKVCVNLVESDLEKCCKMRILMQKSALIQPRTNPLKFGGGNPTIKSAFSGRGTWNNLT